MHFETEATVSAPLQDVWRWWTDYGQPGEKHTVGHGMFRTRRHVVTATPGRVVLEEKPLPFGPSAQHTVEIHEAGHWLLERADQPISMETRWEFFEDDGGRRTRIRRVMDVNAKPVDVAETLTKPLARKMAETDLRHHVREFERDRR